MTANSLEATQRWMQLALNRSDSQVAAATTDYLKDSPKLSAAARLSIYQRSYHARLLECMQLQFPALRQALGLELFDDFAAEYLRSCPPKSPTLQQLGDRFASYLNSARPDSEQPSHKRESWIDFMVDLANFEFAMFRMFDLDGCEGKPLATLATPDTQLKLQPCLSLLNYAFPVGEYYHQVRLEQNPSYPSSGNTHYLLVRKDFVTRTLTLSEPQYIFMAALFAGSQVAEALAHVSERCGRPLAAVHDAWGADDSARSRWINAGVFLPG